MDDRATWTADARPLLDAAAQAVALVLDEPLSFWGGLDQASGEIIDAHHPQRRANVAGRALVMPAGRGSSSSSSVLAEAIRAGYGPRLICLSEPDEIVVVGALVARLLYATDVPVIVLAQADFERIGTGDGITVQLGGRVEVVPVRSGRTTPVRGTTPPT